MKIESSGIVEGIIQDKYGKRGNVDRFGIPTYSLPIKIEGPPAGTKSYALFLEDKDAIPVSGGFAWIHWSAANIMSDELLENASRNSNDFVQGLNSWISIQGGIVPKKYACYYGGMAPPDKPHIYDLTVYALDTILDLNNGFYPNEMFRQMYGHILESATIRGIYNN
ncbi:MAG: YbhB/YbcL family Raf kinase inhibitor-like protein [Peptostreptococcaceae bacterium]